MVRDVSLDIPPAEVTTLLGPNGAGKSTLVLAVAGVLRPRAGQVLLGDVDLTRLPPEKIRQAGVAVVPEGRRLLPDLTVADNLRVATYSLRREAAEQRHRARPGAVPRAEARAGRCRGRYLSGGEQQMVVLAQAIVSGRRRCWWTSCRWASRRSCVKRLVPVLAPLAASAASVSC